MPSFDGLMASYPTGSASAALELTRRMLLPLAARVTADAAFSVAGAAEGGLRLSAALPSAEAAEGVKEASTDGAKASDHSEGCGLAGSLRWSGALLIAVAADSAVAEAEGGLRPAAALPFAGAAERTPK